MKTPFPASHGHESRCGNFVADALGQAPKTPRAGPNRVLYAFDPERNAVLPIGGDKTGNEQWHETSVPLADRLYERHLIELEESDDHGKSKKL